MGNNSFLSKFLLLLIIIGLGVIITFFVINKQDLDNALEDVETITSININTYDEDLYIYKTDGIKLYTSEYFYNNYYLMNNKVSFDEFLVNNHTKYFIKNLSNTEKDIENIKVTYDPISEEEFKFLIENYTLLKVYVWLNEDNSCKNVLLYSSNNSELDIQHY